MGALSATQSEAPATLGRVQAETAELLAGAGVPSPGVDARWLVEAATGCDPRRDPHRVLSSDEAQRLAMSVTRRLRREPLQHIIGTTAFRTIMLDCEPGVFIPRPETEVLAGLAVEALRQRPDDVAPIVLEPCCGTGAIALAIAAEAPGVVVLAADAHAQAVALTRSNRDRLVHDGQLQGSVEVCRGDLLDGFDASLRGQVAVLVSNPPYLPDDDAAMLPPEVADHDPPRALFGGPDGHELVDRLLSAAVEWLAPGGTLLLEIDARRSEEVVALAQAKGLRAVRTHRDLTGAHRFVSARR
jgi:release factor glutamine methyltransferase